MGVEMEYKANATTDGNSFQFTSGRPHGGYRNKAQHNASTTCPTTGAEANTSKSANAADVKDEAAQYPAAAKKRRAEAKARMAAEARAIEAAGMRVPPLPPIIEEVTPEPPTREEQNAKKQRRAEARARMVAEARRIDMAYHAQSVPTEVKAGTDDTANILKRGVADPSKIAAQEKSAHEAEHARRTKDAREAQEARRNQDRELQDRRNEQQAYSAQDGTTKNKRKAGDLLGGATGHSGDHRRDEQVRKGAEEQAAREGEEARRMKEARQAEEARRIKEAREAELARRTKDAREAQEASRNQDRELQDRRNEQQAYSAQDGTTTNKRKAGDLLGRATGHSGDHRRGEQVRKGAEEQAAREDEEARRMKEARQAEEARRIKEAREAEEARRIKEAHEAEYARRIEEARQAEEARRIKQAREAESERRMQEALQFQARLKAQQANIAHAGEMKKTRKAADLPGHVAEHGASAQVNVHEPKHSREARRSQQARPQNDRRNEEKANNAPDGQAQNKRKAANPLVCVSEHDANEPDQVNEAKRARIVPESPATPSHPGAFPQMPTPATQARRPVQAAGRRPARPWLLKVAFAGFWVAAIAIAWKVARQGEAD
jgi:hypothetical protein